MSWGWLHRAFVNVIFLVILNIWESSASNEFLFIKLGQPCVVQPSYPVLSVYTVRILLSTDREIVLMERGITKKGCEVISGLKLNLYSLLDSILLQTASELLSVIVNKSRLWGLYPGLRNLLSENCEISLVHSLSSNLFVVPIIPRYRQVIWKWNKKQFRLGTLLMIKLSEKVMS